MENSHLCPELFPQEAETEAKSRKEESDKAGFGGGPVGGVESSLGGGWRMFIRNIDMFIKGSLVANFRYTNFWVA